MQTSCFFTLRYLDSMIFISGGLGGSLQKLASSEQISFSSVFLEWVFLVLVTYSRSLLVVSLKILYYY